MSRLRALRRWGFLVAAVALLLLTFWLLNVSENQRAATLTTLLTIVSVFAALVDFASFLRSLEEGGDDSPRRLLLLWLRGYDAKGPSQ